MTWQDNAREFGALTKQGKDVRLALLVACSVEPARQGGTGANQHSQRRERSSAKSAAREFAREASTTKERVMRHYRAWEALAGRGLVPPPGELAPDDARTLDVSDTAIAAFEEVFDASGAGGRPRDATPEAATTILNRQDPKVRGRLIAEQLEDPAVREHAVPQLSSAAIDDLEDRGGDVRLQRATARHAERGERVGPRPERVEMAWADNYIARIKNNAEALASWVRDHGLVVGALGEEVALDYLTRAEEVIAENRAALQERARDRQLAERQF